MISKKFGFWLGVALLLSSTIPIVSYADGRYVKLSFATSASVATTNAIPNIPTQGDFALFSYAIVFPSVVTGTTTVSVRYFGTSQNIPLTSLSHSTTNAADMVALTAPVVLSARDSLVVDTSVIGVAGRFIGTAIQNDND